MPESIGGFNFVTIEGVPEDASPQVGIESRFGFNDVYVYKHTDIRGKRFTVVTFADFETVALAETAAQSYKAAIGTTVNMTYAEITQPRKVTILDVRATALRKIVAGYGGLTTVARAKCMAQWTLITRNVASS